jgi:hypothetical protein
MTTATLDLLEVTRRLIYARTFAVLQAIYLVYIGATSSFNAFVVGFAVIFIVLGLGVAARSRVAAVLLLVWQVIFTLILARASGSYVMYLVGLIFAYVFFNGLLATFAYHRLSGVQTPVADEG